MNVILGTLTVLFGIVAFLASLWINWRLGRRNSLSRLLGAGMGASAIPAGFVFLYCAFDPTALSQVSNTPIYIALAGLAVIFVAYQTFFEQASVEDFLEQRKQQPIRGTSSASEYSKPSGEHNRREIEVPDAGEDTPQATTEVPGM